MKRMFWVAVIVLSVVVPCLAHAEAPSAAFVYIGPVGDMGWTWAHDQARQSLFKDAPFIENVMPGDAERVIRDYASKGRNLVIATADNYNPDVLTVASEFPDVHFTVIEGFGMPYRPNVSHYFGRMYQPMFLAGLIAGKMTKTNNIGFVAAYNVNQVIKNINGFALGVKAVNPDAKVHVVWTNTWFGPPQEKAAAEALLAAGSDVIAQHQDSAEPQKAAAEKGAFSIGYDSDMRKVVGDSVLVSAVWDWSKLYGMQQLLLDKGYTELPNINPGLKSGVVGLSDFSPTVPPDLRTLVDGYRAKMTGGQFDVFCGPINDKAGKERVAKDTCPSDAEIGNMDWFVDNVVVPQ